MTEQTDQIADGDNTTTDGSGEKTEKKTVAWETYDKAMNSLAKSKAKLSDLESRVAAFEAQQKAETERKMQEQGQFKELLAGRDKELESLKQTLQAKEQQEIEAKKLSAFISNLGGKLLHNNFLSFVDTEKIVINPETKEVDMQSVKLQVSDFVREYPMAIDFGKSKMMPGDAPSQSNPLDYNAWSKLPLAEKRKRLKDVIKK